MEIRNNTPLNRTSFGMALKKPNQEEMKAFAEYVARNRHLTFVKRGLKQIQREQKNNKYFDIGYRQQNGFNGFAIFSKETGKPISEKYYRQDLTKYPSRHTKAFAALEEEERWLKAGNASKFKQLKFGVKSVYVAIKEALNVMIFNPKEILPAALRKASDEATSMAKAIEKENKTQKTVSEIFDK